MAKKKEAKSKEPFVIVRADKSGVTSGYLVSQTNDGVVLREARRIWQWEGAETVTGLALKGASENSGTRIDQPCPRLDIYREDGMEVAHCTAEAEVNLRKSRWL